MSLPKTMKYQGRVTNAPSYSGVDADFPEGKVTPFESPSSKIFSEIEREVSGPIESNRSLLDGPKLDGLGPEKGRLDWLYDQFRKNPNSENENLLFAEIERYARRVTLGKGGKYARQLDQSVTDAYPVTEISHATTIKVWKKLSSYDGRSKFTTWVYRIALHTLFDACRAAQRRRPRENEYFDWRNNTAEYTGSRGGAGGDGPDNFTSELDCHDDHGDGGDGHSKAPIPEIHRLDPTEERLDEYSCILDGLLLELPPRDQQIVEMYRQSYTPAEISKCFGHSAKWASNQMEKIKAKLRKSASRVAKDQGSNVLAMRGAITSPASEAAD